VENLDHTGMDFKIDFHQITIIHLTIKIEILITNKTQINGIEIELTKGIPVEIVLNEIIVLIAIVLVIKK